MKRLPFALILFFSFLIPSLTFGVEKKCIEGDCKNGQGTLTYSDGLKYVGEFKDGVYHGQGTLTHSDGSKYVGEFKKGFRHGQGTFTTPDGSKNYIEYKDGSPIN